MAGNVLLSWDFNSTAAEYEIRDGAASWDAADFVAKTAATQYIVGGAADGSHTYRVKPIGSTGLYGAEQTVVITVHPPYYDMGFVWGGKPGDGDFVQFVVTQASMLPQNLTGSKGVAGTAVTADTTLTIYRSTDGGASYASKGVATFAASGIGPPAFSFAADVPLAAGDVVKVEMPTPADSTGKDFELTLRANRT